MEGWAGMLARRDNATVDDVLSQFPQTAGEQGKL
jgi:hypothetical protein